MASWPYWNRLGLMSLYVGLSCCKACIPNSDESTKLRIGTDDCITDADCAMKIKEPECRKDGRCNAGYCDFTKTINGTHLSNEKQTLGDCAYLACEDGETVQRRDDTDIDDDNPCTADSCGDLGAVHVPLEQGPCYTGPSKTEGVGICKGGQVQCNDGLPLGDVCPGEQLPRMVEECNNYDDDDCNGVLDCWIRQTGTTKADRAVAIAVDGYGKVYIAGNSDGSLDGSPPADHASIFEVEYTPEAVPSNPWQVSLAVAQNATSIAVDSTTNSVYIGGKTIYTNGVTTGFVQKKMGWHWDLGDGTESTSVTSVAVSGNKRIYVGGWRMSDAPNKNGVIVALDANGMETGYQHAFESPLEDIVTHLAIDSSGNIYVAGTTMGNIGGNSPGGKDIFVAKLNENLQLAWVEQFGTPTIDYAGGLAVDANPNGNVYVIIDTPDLNDSKLHAYTKGGIAIGATSLGISSEHQTNGAQVDSKGIVHVAGWTSNGAPGVTKLGLGGDQDVFVADISLVNGNFSVKYRPLIGSNQPDFASGIALDAFDNVYVAGWTSGAVGSSPSAGDEDAFVERILAP